MKLGTITLNNKLYNLDYMKKDEIEDLFSKNNEDKKNEFIKAKNITKRDLNNDKENNLLDISQNFKNFIDNTTIIVKSEAMLYRAIIDKTSQDTINEKVKNQRNSIYCSIKKINQKFNNTSKKYEEVQESIQNSLKNYEKVLVELAKFYDTKIEQLILRKVELEAHLVGKIIREEFLLQEENKRKEEKENDSLLTSLSNSIKSVISKLTIKKAQKEIDVTMISKLKDKEELELEEKENLKTHLEQTQNDIQDNANEISKLETEILSIEKEIKRLNENKKNDIINAVENPNKGLALKNEKNSIVKKIKRFIQGKFNTSKVIYDTIITPLNNRINEYAENELKDIKFD